MKEEYCKIGIYDSGMGGVSILSKILEKSYVKLDIIYLSDSINNPYGDKEEEELKKIIFNNIEYLISRNCNPIVIACNTATACCIDDLRNKYLNIEFIGTEPAIKVAHDNISDDSKTLFLATKYTCNSSRVKSLVDKYPIKNMKIFQAVGLADLIEWKKIEEIDNYFNLYFSDILDIDCIILGCTHYSLIKDKFKKFFKHAKLYDSCEGVANQLFNLLEQKKVICKKNNIELIDTSNNEIKNNIFEHYLKK